jgi:hypothetical protein
MFLSTENEKSDVASVGPITRAIDPVVSEMPFVAPSECLFGADAVMKMIMQPAFGQYISSPLLVQTYPNTCQSWE